MVHNNLNSTRNVRLNNMDTSSSSSLSSACTSYECGALSGQQPPESLVDCFSPCEFVGVQVIVNHFHRCNMSGWPSILRERVVSVHTLNPWVLRTSPLRQSVGMSLDNVYSSFAHDLSLYCVNDIM